MKDRTQVFNMDCMEAMREFPDKYFELAIVDPPYGIGADVVQNSSGLEFGFKRYVPTNWDTKTPSFEYFEELERVSINQIIFGGNYFVEYLRPSMGWVVWDKVQRLSFSDGELIYTSFQKALRIFTEGRGANQGFNNVGRMHPTQKPISLYKWLLKNYAKEGDKILDTHLGSGSSRIAAFDWGFELYGYELDAEYFEASCKRFEQHKSQLQIVW